MRHLFSGFLAIAIIATACQAGDASETTVSTTPPTSTVPTTSAPVGGELVVFARYDLSLQFDTMALVASRSATPVPAPRWYEPDASVLGGPFFVMDHVEGRVPADNLPYTVEGWLLDAAPADRLALQDDTVWAIAGVHAVDLTGINGTRYGYDPAGPSALHQHVQRWQDYQRWVAGDAVLPTIDAAWRWLDEHWPADDGGPPRLSWGDARIGNVVYEGFRPAALLDWEMVGIAPPGVDLAWMAYLHVFFHDVAVMLEGPGLPGYLDLDDIAEIYEARTGITLGDRQFWMVYAAVRYALIMIRIHARRVAFGEAEPDPDPEAGTMHLDWLAAAIA